MWLQVKQRRFAFFYDSISTHKTWKSSETANPNHNLNKADFQAFKLGHADVVWAFFSWLSDTPVLGNNPGWSSPSLWPLYWRLARSKCGAASFYTWGPKSSSFDLYHSGLGFMSAQRSPVMCCFPFSSESKRFFFSKCSQCWKSNMDILAVYHNVGFRTLWNFYLPKPAKLLIL